MSLNMCQERFTVSQNGKHTRDGWVLVTPDIARQYLSTNTANRRVRAANVKKYALDMRRGAWVSNKTEPIAFDENGVLIQGQHRLLAVIDSGVSIRFWVCFDETAEAYSCLDQGVKRNLSDITKRPQHVAEVVRLAAEIAYGKPSRDQQFRCDAIIGDVADELVCTHPSRVRVLSAAPVRLAAVVSSFVNDKEYAFGLYGKLVSGAVDGLPPIAVSLIGQVLRGSVKVSGGTYNGLHVAARAYKVFDPACADQQRLLVRDDSDFVAPLQLVVC